ncbi:hypothetical protein KGM_201715 [Danaus plexippus plexippus]|uniref:Chitin-binding type-2 domain-containing protein n=1 Tax=Danaus plexippus plexippus TaxID=278856 RepID=A0A212FE29_DANPL|nr:hypothetical protein KGM_201716 [Danaus plexippus plexippus]OWR51984.1 hypothetical protein KGM_201715 [Danaus plexippus plexippus]
MFGFRRLLFLFIALVCFAENKAADTSRSKRCMDKSVTPVSCKGATYDGYFMKHPDDCNLFYYCATPQSEAVCVECPNNQQFNAKRRACDAPYRANCNL